LGLSRQSRPLLISAHRLSPLLLWLLLLLLLLVRPRTSSSIDRLPGLLLLRLLWGCPLSLLLRCSIAPTHWPPLVLLLLLLWWLTVLLLTNTRTRKGPSLRRWALLLGWRLLLLGLQCLGHYRGLWLLLRGNRLPLLLLRLLRHRLLKWLLLLLLLEPSRMHCCWCYRLRSSKLLLLLRERLLPYGLLGLRCRNRDWLLRWLLLLLLLSRTCCRLWLLLLLLLWSRRILLLLLLLLRWDSRRRLLLLGCRWTHWCLHRRLRGALLCLWRRGLRLLLLLLWWLLLLLLYSSRANRGREELLLLLWRGWARCTTRCHAIGVVTGACWGSVLVEGLGHHWRGGAIWGTEGRILWSHLLHLGHGVIQYRRIIRRRWRCRRRFGDV